MNMFVIDSEIYLRLSFFMGVFSVMAAREVIAPRRSLHTPRHIRWFSNLTITFFNGIAVRLLLPLTVTGIAVVSSERNWGIFNAIGVPPLVAGTITIIVLDLTIYTQHVIFHKFPFFWRLHRMHHTDLDIDVTTGARFHPLEIILSMGIKSAVVMALGAPQSAVFTFEVLLNATSMFNHSNVFMNERVDSIVRAVLVTPDMHRVHHSVLIKETDSNFGFNLSWWDRLFGTYHAQPERGHKDMSIGLANYRDQKWLTLPWMIIVPFSSKYR